MPISPEPSETMKKMQTDAFTGLVVWWAGSLRERKVPYLHRHGPWFRPTLLQDKESRQKKHGEGGIVFRDR
jgi:hypothetical protein